MNYIYSLLKNNVNSSGHFIDEKNRWSYFEFNEIVIEQAKKLKKYGVSKGSKVAIVLDNRPLEFVKMFFAIAYLDAIPFPIYTNSGEDKIVNIINYYEIDYALGCFRKIGELWNVYDFNSYSIVKTNNPVKDDINPETNLVLFTSGTTSMPKAIMLSEKNLRTNVEGISEYLSLKKDDRIFILKNLNHSSTIVGEMMMGVFNGVDLYFTNKIYTINNVEKTIRDNKITVLFAVPTIIKSILEKGKTEDYSSLRILNFYGGKLGEKDIKRLCNMMSNCEIVYSYGLTEAAPRVTYIKKKDQLTHLGSSGKCIRNVKLYIINDDAELPPGEIGQIVVEGDNVMLGYYKNPLKTAKTIIDGKLYTGDLGYKDKDGFLYVVGRNDNMFIYSGKNVYLEEIESTIMAYPGVLESLVTPMYNDDEIVGFKSYIVMKEKETFDYKNMFSYCLKNIELYKVPKEIVVVDEFEKTASGKIKRNQSFILDNMK